MSNQCQNNGTYYGFWRTVTCLDGAIAFLAGLLALALGVILGAVFYTTFLPVLATIIVFGVIMLVGIAALLIYRYCAYRR